MKLFLLVSATELLLKIPFPHLCRNQKSRDIHPGSWPIFWVLCASGYHQHCFKTVMWPKQRTPVKSQVQNCYKYFLPKATFQFKLGGLCTIRHLKNCKAFFFKKEKKKKRTVSIGNFSRGILDNSIYLCLWHKIQEVLKEFLPCSFLKERRSVNEQMLSIAL